MSKCSCGVVPGDCYDACGARESKISDLINERDEAMAEAEALRESLQWIYEHGKDGASVETLTAYAKDAAIDQAKRGGE